MVHPTLLDIIKARNVLAAYLRPTPLYRSPGFSEMLGFDLYIKYENHQPIRSFKVRGGLYSLSLLNAEQRRRGVVTASTGNHGQGVAYAAGAMGIPSVIVIPHGTPRVKSDAIKHLGAQLTVYGHDLTESFEHAKVLAAESGKLYLEDGEDFGLMAGAGTIGLEIVEQWPEVDAIVAPVGGGNLIAGLSVAVKTLNPAIRIIGVQADQAPAVYRSWKEGRLISTDTSETFAGGLATRFPGGLAFEVLKDRVDEMHLVSEAEMKRAIPVILAQTGYIAEGATAAVFALCLREAAGWSGRRVAALFTGGNLGIERLREVMGEGD